MKKVFLVLLALCVLLSVAGCSGAGNTVADLRGYNDFITGFNALVSELPEYTILQLQDAPIEAGGLAHIFHIKDALLDETYRLQVNATDAKITRVALSAERNSYGDLQFAVFSFYVYASMGFPEIDPDAFYEKYDLFSTEKIYETDMCGAYEITSFSIESTNEITFTIRICE